MQRAFRGVARGMLWPGVQTWASAWWGQGEQALGGDGQGKKGSVWPGLGRGSFLLPDLVVGGFERDQGRKQFDWGQARWGRQPQAPPSSVKTSVGPLGDKR